MSDEDLFKGNAVLVAAISCIYITASNFSKLNLSFCHSHVGNPLEKCLQTSTNQSYCEIPTYTPLLQAADYIASRCCSHIKHHFNASPANGDLIGLVPLQTSIHIKPGVYDLFADHVPCQPMDGHQVQICFHGEIQPP